MWDLRSNILKQLHPQIRFIEIILCNTEISLGGLEVAMIIDSHHYYGQYLSASAGVVSPGFSKAVAGDFAT